MLDRYNQAEISAKLFYKDVSDPEFVWARGAVGEQLLYSGVEWTILNASTFRGPDGNEVGLVELYHAETR